MAGMFDIFGFGGGGPMGGPQMGAGGALGFLSGGNTPQDWGQGIQNAPFQPYFTGPGIVPGQHGLDPNFDQASPGFGEQYFQQHGGQFGQPTQAGDYWSQIQGQYGRPPQGTNFSQTEYQNFQRPVLAEDPGLEPYYARARDRLTQGIDREFAGRGMYGSSAAFDQLSEGLGGLNAEQANREAAYNLQRTAEQRLWEQLGGQLAGQADANSRGNTGQELQWLMGMGNLAGNADSSNLANLMGGMNAANMAQQLQMGRGQNYFNNMMGLSGGLADIAGQNYADMLGTDAGLMNNALMFESGLAQLALQASLYNQQRQKADPAWAKGMMGGKGGGKGGKG